VERAVSHLLRYAREEEMKLADVDLAQVVDAAVASLPERATSAQVRIERDADTGAKLRGDAEKLRRVVVNLVSNALDALGAGGVRDPRVRISAGRSLAGSEVWLRVTDNGPGIDEKYHEKIFQLFQTLAPRDNGESTGIGLTLVKKIVELYGGEVWLESTPGEGSTFFFTLPKIQGEAQHERLQTGTACGR
jgi:signal transduction histidine kinase